MTKKLTRNSYKRKVILFGLVIFMSIALISTGFAAWVLSQDSKAEDGGNINVGAVSEGNLKVTLDEIQNPNFIFEPTEDDTAGRVRNDGTNFENLKVTITGTIDNADFLGDLEVKLDVPQAVLDAAEAGYIILPECATTVVNLNEVEGAVSLEGDAASFSYTIEFKWGATFGNMNPGLYYDIHEAGMAVSYDDLKSTLETFYGAMGASNPYTVTVTAKVK